MSQDSKVRKSLNSVMEAIKKWHPTLVVEEGSDPILTVLLFHNRDSLREYVASLNKRKKKTRVIHSAISTVALVDNIDERTIRYYNLDRVKHTEIPLGDLLEHVFQWKACNNTVPLCVHLTQQGFNASEILETASLDSIIKITGPTLPYYQMDGVFSIKRKRRKNPPSVVNVTTLQLTQNILDTAKKN